MERDSPYLQRRARPVTPILTCDIRTMIDAMDLGGPAVRLAGLRDRVLLLIAYAGALRRGKVVALDVHRPRQPDRQNQHQKPK
ncbi:hypothetical protein MXD62_22280 [Frankia sp. Mgl5]|uniref:hypothetical protein n=1 Tax=Frankia sp. Mgl5 TaxID=2933793 RepID=UPI00200D6067|nr:hypothetical protein [Frankia sp. Mgl5]MCK9929864.1 hypothetical protein [Frankia sp. Mgl5]